MTQDRIRTAWKSIFHQKKCKIFVTVIKCCEHNKKKAVLSVASVQCVPKKWDKVFKNGPSKICGRQPLENLKWYDLLKQTISLQRFWRLSSTNFTWSILEHFFPNDPQNIQSRICIPIKHWLWFFFTKTGVRF